MRVLVIIIAVVNLLIAIGFIGCGACANYWDARKPWNIDVNNKRVADEEMLQAHLKKTVPGYPAVKIVGIVLGYAACVGLILASIALFFGKGWGKYVAAAIFVLALFHHLIAIAYQLIWMNPAIETFFNQIPRPAIINQAADVLITTQSYNTRMPGYISIAWWVTGCIYYVLATPAVLFIPIAGPKDDKKINKKKKPRDEEEEEDEDDRETRRRRKK
jgi:hypothetical protein